VAGKVTVGLASHWPCVTDFSGLSTCGLTAYESEIIIIIIIYSLKIGDGQQGRISGTYNCPQYKIKCKNIKYKRITENTFIITT